MPPSAAPEWLRTGWIFEISATSAPASNASMAARIPAQPAPTTRTSCFASTTSEATQTYADGAALRNRAAARERSPGQVGSGRWDDHDGIRSADLSPTERLAGQDSLRVARLEP